MNEIKITNEQAEIIGREIGEAFAEKFWQKMNDANPKRMAQVPGAFFIERFGREVGRGMAEHGAKLHITYNENQPRQ